MKKKLPFHNPEITRALTAAGRYRLKYTLLLVSIPLFCGILLLLLFYVFAELNLYFLEANGLILDEQVRDAYFQQLGLEIFGVIGYLALQVGATLIAATIVMRWACAPFTAASAAIRSALEKKEPTPRASSSWFSECPSFERQINQFAQSVKQEKKLATTRPQAFGTNYPFLLKFVAVFSVLSLSTGYVVSIILDSVYTRIVTLALQTVKANQYVGHYFVAQQDILQKANSFTVALSILLYFLVGLQISRYMGSMIFLFSRAIHEDLFPITLRATDIYSDLADSLNEGRRRFK